MQRRVDLGEEHVDARRRMHRRASGARAASPSALPGVARRRIRHDDRSEVVVALGERSGAAFGVGEHVRDRTSCCSSVSYSSAIVAEIGRAWPWESSWPSSNRPVRRRGCRRARSSSRCNTIPLGCSDKHALDLVGQRQSYVCDEWGEIKIHPAREHDGNKLAIGIDAAGDARLNMLHALARYRRIDWHEARKAKDARVLLRPPSKEPFGCHAIEGMLGRIHAAMSRDRGNDVG